MFPFKQVNAKMNQEAVRSQTMGKCPQYVTLSRTTQTDKLGQRKSLYTIKDVGEQSLRQAQIKQYDGRSGCMEDIMRDENSDPRGLGIQGQGM